MNSEKLQKLNVQLGVNKKLAVNNKLGATNRPKYISKAEREKVFAIESSLRMDVANLLSEAQP